MSNAYVFNEALPPADKEKVRKVLADAGFNPLFGAAKTDPKTLNAASDIGVLCLPADPSESDVLDNAVEAFASAGLRVITIYLDTKVDGLPESVGDLGTAAVGISSKDMDKALKGEPIWEEPDGKPRPIQPLRRNKC